MLIALLLMATGEAGYSDEGPSAATLRQGWPVEIDNPIYSSPAYGDLDSDGCLEVVVGVPVGGTQYTSGKYYAWHHDGTLLAGWPVATTYPVATSPAIADLDDDGAEEVIGASLGFRELYAWDHSGSVLGGFPVDISNGIHIWQGGGYMLDSSPAIGDIDGDSTLDIIIASCKSLWVVDAGGQPLEGWPLLFPETHIGYSDVAVGDIDNDALLELVVAFGYEENLYPYTRHSYVYVFRSDGELLNDHWPKEFTNENLGIVRNSPVLGNLDDDEDLEIVMASDAHWQSGTLATLHAWNLDGSDLFPPLSIPSDWYYVSGLTLADLDGDSVPEILMGAGNNKFIVVDATGSILYQNKAVIRGGATPVVGRVDHTPDQGIVIGGFYGDLYAWYGDGSSIPGFVYAAGGFISTSPALADLDFNGRTELIVSSTDRKVYVWELNAVYDPATIEWAMFRHDPWHTGCYTCGVTPSDVLVPGIGVASNGFDLR
jgi:hypothetical protein